MVNERAHRIQRIQEWGKHNSYTNAQVVALTCMKYHALLLGWDTYTHARRTEGHPVLSYLIYLHQHTGGHAKCLILLERGVRFWSDWICGSMGAMRVHPLPKGNKRTPSSWAVLISCFYSLYHAEADWINVIDMTTEKYLYAFAYACAYSPTYACVYSYAYG